MLDTINKAIEQTKNVSGDLLFFRVYKGDTIIRLIKSGVTDKHMFLVHNSTGLETPTIFDYEKDNKTCLYKKGRFAYSKKDLLSRLNSNLKGKNNVYSILDYRSIADATSKLSTITPSVCIIDLIQYEPTKISLEYCFNIIPTNGCIIISNYLENSRSLSSKAVNEFVEENSCDIKTYVNTIEKSIIITKSKFTPLILEAPSAVEQNSDPNLIIACVLRTGGGVYDYNYVNALANAVKRNVTVPHTFVCLTNDSSGFNNNVDSVIPLKHDFRKWWCKMELFRPDIFNGKQVFFLDLDTVIIDNIDQIVTKTFEFCGLRDFYKITTLGSGLMSWRHDKYHYVYERFLKNPTYIMNNTPEGDQRWINENVKSMKYFQDVFGNNVVSYKKDCVKNKAFRLPKNTKIVCFHGVPKPHEIQYPEIKDHWLP
jgi:hypothetical protein